MATDTIGQALVERAQRTPDALAILARDRAPTTFADLTTLANHVGETLREAGVSPVDRVATVIPGGPEMAALFICASAHATVVPLNSSCTLAEIESLISDVGAKAVVVEPAGNVPARVVAEKLGIVLIELFANSREASVPFRLKSQCSRLTRQSCQVGADSVALVLHTSGTTSRPKRVPLTHANLMSSAANFQEWYGLKTTDRALSIMPYYHIQGIVGGILAPLLSGGSIVCSRRFDGDTFFELLDEFEANWYTAGPTYHQAILARAPRHREIIQRRPLRFIRSSSAPLAPQSMLELERVFGAPMLEGYGLTETCLHSLSNPLPPRRRKPGSVGLSAGTAVAIMDELGKLLTTPGTSGEVCLRGATVMAGYEDNPQANASAFVNGWFRTGDQGYFDDDGYLILTGRFKELINRGGEKISPVEIDHVLLDHPDVTQAVSFSLPHPTLGEDVGVAIVRRDGADVDEAGIRTFAAKALAPFKVPRQIVFVDTIPKSTVGKSLRLGLAEKLGLAHATGQSVVASDRPESSTETMVAKIWQKALHRDVIGVDDDFFTLGGDSLQAAHVLADILKTFEMDISYEALFIEASTIASQANAIDDLRAGKLPSGWSRPKIQSRDSPLYASYAQKGFWIGSHLFREQPKYNVVNALRLRGQLEYQTLTRSLESVVKRQESLRARFYAKDGQLFQESNQTKPITLQISDSREIAGRDSEDRAKTWAQEMAQRPFDITQGQLWRIGLLRMDDEDHALLVVLHHAISDGWGSDILIDDLFETYAWQKGNETSRPSTPELQFADFAVWQRQCWESGEYDSDLVYWRDYLANLPPILKLPTDQPHANLPSWQGRKSTLALAPEQVDSLKCFSRAHRATLFMTLLTAFDSLLHVYTAATDIVVGVPIANRQLSELEKVVGCFVNALPFRTDLTDDPTFEETLRRVRRSAAKFYSHQRFPGEILVEQLLPSKPVGEDAFYCILFQLRNYRFDRKKTVGDLIVTPFDFDPGISMLELSVDWEFRGGGLLCGFTYRSDLFTDATIALMMERYMHILETLIADPNRRLSQI